MVKLQTWVVEATGSSSRVIQPEHGRAVRPLYQTPENKMGRVQRARRKAPNARILVVGNKTDLESGRVKAMDFADLTEADCTETSATDGKSAPIAKFQRESYR